MHEPAVSHRHGDGTEHAHLTVLAPEVATLLQKLEDFLECLDLDEAMALRRLIKAGLATGESVHAELSRDAVGYRHEWYREHIAIRHGHGSGDGSASSSVASSSSYTYRPLWWPTSH